MLFYDLLDIELRGHVKAKYIERLPNLLAEIAGDLQKRYALILISDKI